MVDVLPDEPGSIPSRKGDRRAMRISSESSLSRTDRLVWPNTMGHCSVSSCPRAVGAREYGQYGPRRIIHILRVATSTNSPAVSIS